MWDHLHQEEARHTDDDHPMELAGVAPPCKVCGQREAVDDGLCECCSDDD